MGLKLWKAFAASLALHGTLAAVCVGAYLWQPPAPAREQPLALDLLALVSNRQLEARAASSEPPPQAAPAPPPRKIEPRKKRPRRPEPPTPPVPSPIETEKPPQRQEESAPALAQEQAESAPEIHADDVNQQQQSLSNPGPWDARYVADLSKAIRSRLTYPAEARKNRMAGVPVVRFHLDEGGYIRAGSLQILRTSGYTLLDRKALEATEASAPFAPPPHAMDVVIALTFAFATRAE